MTEPYREFYRGRRVLITGGLGFIGSNLAHALVDLDADVLLVDSLIPDYGGNLANIAGFGSRLRVNIADVRQASTMSYLVQGRDVIFNLAGQVSHIDSMRDPHTDLEINCRSQLTILEAGDVREVTAVVGEQRVDEQHVGAERDEVTCQVRSDEAESAGDEDAPAAIELAVVEAHDCARS